MSETFYMAISIYIYIYIYIQIATNIFSSGMILILRSNYSWNRPYNAGSELTCQRTYHQEIWKLAVVSRGPFY